MQLINREEICGTYTLRDTTVVNNEFMIFINNIIEQENIILGGMTQIQKDKCQCYLLTEALRNKSSFASTTDPGITSETMNIKESTVMMGVAIENRIAKYKIFIQKIWKSEASRGEGVNGDTYIQRKKKSKITVIMSEKVVRKHTINYLHNDKSYTPCTSMYKYTYV